MKAPLDREVATLRATIQRLEAERGELKARLKQRRPRRLLTRLAIVAMFPLGAGTGIATACAGSTALGHARLLSREAAIPPDATVTLQRTGCYGSCPTYRVTVHQDGTIDFFGLQDVAHPGSDSYAVPKEEAARLFKAIPKSKLFEMSDAYYAPWTDGPGAVVTLHWAGEDKTIMDNVVFGAPRIDPRSPTGMSGNQVTPKPREPYCEPPALTKLEDLIDEVARTRPLVKVPVKTAP